MDRFGYDHPIYDDDLDPIYYCKSDPPSMLINSKVIFALLSAFQT